MGLQKEAPCQDGTLNDHHLMQVMVQVNVKSVITESLKDNFFLNFIIQSNLYIKLWWSLSLSLSHLQNLWKINTFP